ncbi:outer membrane protein [Beijerinckia indica]|uniref:Porin n=1 Tax=Beijerinckia indica subsp. indica (strain ATCC 9039 / DSM 1715 / NCIMB 8712) TaxID=395963 RepID=B2IHC2_BEII9|nr:outer membrane protein [Beijerinckia indica]ACB95907.1 porin [Beijerinckia indica subsp. indica ATCC 9039]
MLRKFLLSTTAFAALSGAALAADLPSRAAPPVYVPPVPIFTWTGVYVGGDIGYAWGNTSYNSQIFSAPARFAFGSYSPDGVTGGAHVGYNFQAGPSFIGTGNFVIGIEGDVQGSNYSKSVVGFANDIYTSKLDITGSIRGRLGIAFDRALIYATGGAAFGGITNQLQLRNGAFFSNDRTAVGWTVGGGIEYAVTNNWSVRAQYLYSDYGHTNSFFPNAQVHKHDTQNKVTVGFSYKFDTFAPLAPVVAKY